jgi:hypothetical protein
MAVGVWFMECLMRVQPKTGKMQEENEQDQTDDPEEHVPAPGRGLSSRGWPPRRGLLVLFAQPVRRHAPRLVHRERRRHEQHK